MEGVLFFAIMIIGWICYVLIMLKVVKEKQENNKALEQGWESCCKSLESLNHTLEEEKKKLDEMCRIIKRSNKKQNEALNSYFNN